MSNISHGTTELEAIRTTFPDNFGIKEMLRNGKVHNPEFLDLTLKSYDTFSRLRSQRLSITESLQANENVTIFDHQILAAQRIKNMFGGTAMLADEVGLGKTIEAGIVIKEFLVTGLAEKILVLAPPSLLQQWKDELSSKFSLDFISHRDDPRFKSVLSHDLLLMSHSSAASPKQSALLNEVYWDMVVVDEAHSMKNATTLKHNLVKNLPKRNLLLLTATPIQNNLEEMYNLIELLRPGHLGTWNQFRKKYAADRQCRTINPVFRDELQKILSEIVIRTTRKEVRRYIKFTDRIPHTQILTPAGAEHALYDAITEIVRNQYMSDRDTFALMNYQRQASSSTDASRKALYKMKSNGVIPDERYGELMSVADSIGTDSKLSHLLDIVRGSHSKFLVFTEFYATQDYVSRNLEDDGHSVTVFNGKMSPEEKRDSVMRFKNDVQVMVSTSAGGEGQNFQFCHNIVNYDLPWNPMRVEQRIGRVHRIGQQNDVQVFNFALRGTIESYILELLYEKINLFQMALGDMDLLFEDSWSMGSQQTWFKEYMSALDEEERRNKFSAMGDDLKDRKQSVSGAIHDFNNDVFTNFDLSVLREAENEHE